MFFVCASLFGIPILIMHNKAVEQRGLLIVNEGPDGSGKATQTALLRERLTLEGKDVRQYDFPSYGRDPIADLIRTMLKTMQDLWNARTFESRALLYAANRAVFRDEIRAHLAEGRTVICDRYVGSNQAHMAGYSEDPRVWEERFAWIENLEYRMIGLPQPDMVLLHTMPAETRATLLRHREAGKEDAHEANRPYLVRVEECYRALAERGSDVWRHIPADVGGIVESPEQVHARVWQAVVNHPAWVSDRARVPARV